MVSGSQAGVGSVDLAAEYGNLDIHSVRYNEKHRRAYIGWIRWIYKAHLSILS